MNESQMNDEDEATSEGNASFCLYTPMRTSYRWKTVTHL